jgi:hypothetical protein
MKRSQIEKLAEDALLEIVSGKRPGRLVPYVYTVYYELPLDEGNTPAAVKFTVSREHTMTRTVPKVRIVDAFNIATGDSIILGVDPLDVKSLQGALEGDDIIDWEAFDPYYIGVPKTSRMNNYKSPEDEVIPGDEEFYDKIRDYYTKPPTLDYWEEIQKR